MCITIKAVVDRKAVERRVKFEVAAVALSVGGVSVLAHEILALRSGVLYDP